MESLSGELPPTAGPDRPCGDPSRTGIWPGKQQWPESPAPLVAIASVAADALQVLGHYLEHVRHKRLPFAGGQEPDEVVPLFARQHVKVRA